MSDILTRIAADKKIELEELKKRVPLEVLKSVVEQKERDHSFWGSLISRSDHVKIIAELKKTSPSKGLLHKDYHPATIAQKYASGGANALSVLTETKYFLGDPAHLPIARRVSGLPTLCKDFVIDEYQFYHARYIDADAILLIARMHDRATLQRYLELSDTLDLDVLVETHTEDEVKMADDAGAAIIGVNNRDLATFEVDLRIAERLSKFIPSDVVAVVESGINSRADVLRMQESGYNCFLIGEALMKSPDPAALLKELRGV